MGGLLEDWLPDLVWGWVHSSWSLVTAFDFPLGTYPAPVHASDRGTERIPPSSRRSPVIIIS